MKKWGLLKIVFKDRGIAYDTDYTNRMILLGIPVVCMKPSYVQNIGIKGYYQKGGVTIVPDFVGENRVYNWLKRKYYFFQRIYLRMRKKYWGPIFIE